jgi:hypothetical protein
MRQQWTETDVLALPAGEHDWFERKAGALYDPKDLGGIRGALAKALSAFANTGGGSLVLGIEDNGTTFDGLPRMHGSTSTREWIEQVVPNLVLYPLVEFRVHEVQPDPTTSAIPSGRVVIVVDVGDSSAAPHQCDYGGGGAHKYVYYMRQGGHSVPAPHRVVELIRQRLTAPMLTAELLGFRLRKAAIIEGAGAAFAHVEVVMQLPTRGGLPLTSGSCRPRTSRVTPRVATETSSGGVSGFPSTTRRAAFASTRPFFLEATCKGRFSSGFGSGP